MQPSLNPETTGKPGTQLRAVAPHAGVWGKSTLTPQITPAFDIFNPFLFIYVTENPPSGKQMVSKMLVIKKVSKEDPGTAFSAGFATTGVLPTNGSKAPIAGSSVYKNLVPKPAVAPTKVRIVCFMTYFQENCLVFLFSCICWRFVICHH